MKIKKTVMLDSGTLLKAVRSIPGLQKTAQMIVRNSLGSIQNNWTIEVTWTDDEIIDGIHNKKGA